MLAALLIALATCLNHHACAAPVPPVAASSRPFAAPAAPPAAAVAPAPRALLPGLFAQLPSDDPDTPAAVDAQQTSAAQPAGFAAYVGQGPDRCPLGDAQVAAGIPLSALVFEALGHDGRVLQTYHGQPQIEGIERTVGGEQVPLGRFQDGMLLLESGPFTDDEGNLRFATVRVAGDEVVVRTAEAESTFPVRQYPAWLSIVPPVIAVGVAILLRNVLVALFLGVFSGALILARGDPLAAYVRTFDTYLLEQLTDADHVKVILFTLFIGGLVGVLSRGGGTAGIVQWLSRYANTPLRCQLLTWVMGLIIFFDDYANCFLVGATMRPMTDRYRISREKLAFIVDSTAAPVAGLVIVSTWIGTELAYIRDAYTALGFDQDISYGAFLHSIPFRFYAIHAIVFVAIIAWLRRDFGPMLSAEVRAEALGQVSRPGSAAALAGEAARAELDPPDDAKLRATNALVPLVVIVALVVVGLLLDYDSYDVLLVASFTASLVAIAMAVGRRILTLAQATDAWLAGARGMVLAVAILTLAWGVAGVSSAEQGGLDTAGFVVQLAGERVPAWTMPTVAFVLASAISFATGTSWGTMGILMPLMIPLAYRVLGQVYLDVDPYDSVMLGTIGAVLAGAIFGDHCSPISDTTVLSSQASSCDHMDHVTTQMPYALAVAGVSIALGYLPAAFGVTPLLLLPMGQAALVAIVWYAGRSVAEVAATVKPGVAAQADPSESHPDEAHAESPPPRAEP